MADVPRLWPALAVLLWSAGTAADPLRLVGVDRRPLGPIDGAVEYLVTVRFVNGSEDVNESPYVIAAIPSDGRLVDGSATGPGAVVSLLGPAREEPEPTAGVDEDSPQEVDPAETPGAAVGPGGRIRWDLPGPMDPGVTGIVSFRMLVALQGDGEHPAQALKPIADEATREPVMDQ